MSTMWRIWADIRNLVYDFPDCVGKTLYRWIYMPDWDRELLYPGWYIDSHMKFSQVPVPHDDFPHLLPSLCFSYSSLPSPKNSKLNHYCLSLHAMIESSHQVQHIRHTAYAEYSIHWLQHTLATTAYTVCCIIPRSTVPYSRPVSHLSADHVVFISLTSHTHELINE